MPDADRLRAITEPIRAVCAEHLTDEYGALAVAAAEAFAATDAAPLLLRGKAAGWAAGFARAVGAVNFLSDPASEPAMPLDDLAARFGVSKATASARHHEIRAALDLVQMDPHWTLPSQLLDNPMAWMLVVNGLPVDVRDLPLDLQRVLADQGHVPFAPGDPAARPPTPRWPEPETETLADTLDPDAPRLRLRVSLDDVTPDVWREVVVPSDLPLDGLHEVLQTAMGWEDDHLHTFESGRRTWGPAGAGWDVEDERDATVGEVLRRKGARLAYTYDMGDDWRHTVRLEERLPPDPGAPPFDCTAGAGACPPEDCGGPWGYADLLAILADPAHPEHAERIEWTGGPLDPHAFDLDGVRRDLRGGPPR